MNARSVSELVRELALHIYPATGSEIIAPLVLLHGWGCDSRTWQLLLPGLQALGDVIAVDLPGFGASPSLPAFELDVLLDMLEKYLPDGAVLIGWSLGGMLAVALAARHPHKVSRLVTLATNIKFVADHDYPNAMPPAINQGFNQGFAADPAGTLRLFSGLLAQGDATERTLLKRLRGVDTAGGMTGNSWGEALELLARLDNRTAFSQLTQPGLHLFGESDVLVPAVIVETLSSLNPLQQCLVLPHAAHAFHWSQPTNVIQSIEDFLRLSRLDKRRVAQSFSRAAPTYDAVARLQQAVGARLLQQLPLMQRAERVLDLGCGTGFFSQPLARHFAGAHLLGLDIAEGMLAYARNQQGDGMDWLCADAERLPLATASVDVVFSSLAIQWCEQPEQLFTELRRVLRPGGYLLFSTLGPETLRELKCAWQSVDGYVHVNRFYAAGDLQGALSSAGFQINCWQEETCQLHYEKLGDLTRELKALGAHNSNRGQANGLTSRRKLEALKNAYEQFRCQDYLPASYEVYYALAQVPVESPA